MDLFQKLYLYCERLNNPSFWAEPLNALSNAAFLIAAFAALATYLSNRHLAEGVASKVLIILAFVIGVGSFLFHTFAERWSFLADVVPIGLFMLVYTGAVLLNVLRPGRLQSALLFGAFVGISAIALRLRCDTTLQFLNLGDASGRCLNGSVMYAPAWTTLVIGALWTQLIGHRLSRYLWGAAGLFLVALSFRTIDLPLCEQLTLFNTRMGSHFLWHMFNAAVIYVMLKGYITTVALAGAATAVEPRRRLPSSRGQLTTPAE